MASVDATMPFAERVLHDDVLLRRILWDSKALSVRDLCLAACVKRAWRNAAQADFGWRSLLLAATTHAHVFDSGAAFHERHGSGAAVKRAVMQLYRVGYFPPPLTGMLFGLQDYTVLMHVLNKKRVVVASITVPLVNLQVQGNYAWLHGSAVSLPASAATFLERVAHDETDTRELRLQLLLRRNVDGALAVLASGQNACRWEDSEEHVEPHYDAYLNFGLYEHRIWEAGEHSNTRNGAGTWSSSAERNAPVRLFERPVFVADDPDRPARWTWRVQFPAADADADQDDEPVTQLTNMTLRIGLCERHNSPRRHDFDYYCVRVSLGALLKMLEQRDAATRALWLPL